MSKWMPHKSTPPSSQVSIVRSHGSTILTCITHPQITQPMHGQHSVLTWYGAPPHAGIMLLKRGPKGGAYAVPVSNLYIMPNDEETPIMMRRLITALGEVIGKERVDQMVIAYRAKVEEYITDNIVPKTLKFNGETRPNLFYKVRCCNMP